MATFVAHGFFLTILLCISVELVLTHPSGLSDNLEPNVPWRLDGEKTGDNLRERHIRSHRRGTVSGHFLKSGLRPPPVQSVALYDSAVLECEFQGSPPPSINWLRDGNILLTSGLLESIEESTNSLETLLVEPSEAILATHSRLYLDCVTAGDQGVYTCEGDTGYHTKSVSTSLYVQERANEDGMIICSQLRKLHFRPARILQWRSHILAKMGSEIRLVCETAGYPKPTVAWMKDDAPIPANNPRITVLSNGDLYIEKLEWSDMGLYQCSASNDFTEDKVTTFLYPFKP